MTADIQPAGSPHRELLEWALSQGVQINDVHPARILNRGLGIIAEKPIKAGAEIVKVPIAALITTDCIPKRFVVKHDASLTVHGLLASFLTNGNSSLSEMGKYRFWQATWPTYSDFVQCMPLLWPTKLRERWTTDAAAEEFWLLPPCIGATHGSWDYSKKPARNVATDSLIGKQQRKLEIDLEKTLAVYPDMDQRQYVRNWMIINTRSFYYDRPLRRKPVTHDDMMILCPVIDYFNHSDGGCVVTFDHNGYCVTTDRDYDAGEELFVNYGAHDNDTLLTEYGFLPEMNKFDCVSLDAWVLAPSTGVEKAHISRLRKAAYFENYNIVAVEGYGQVCHRTHVAVRAATMKPNRWLLYVKGKNPVEGEEEACQFLQGRILIPFKQTVQKSLNGLKGIDAEAQAQLLEDVTQADKDVGFAHIISTLIRRWQQIDKLIGQAIDHIDD